MAEVVAFIKAGVKFIATLGAQGSAIAAATVVAGAALVGKGVMNLFEIEMPQADTDGSRQRTVRGTTVARKLVYGQALVSGPITYIGVSGTDNEDLYQVIALAGHEVNDITDIHFDDVVIPDADINSGSSAGGAVGGTGIFKAQNSTTIVTINKHLGTATQSADSMMVGAFTDYTSAHQGKGVAYIAMKWKLNEDSQETWDKYSPNDVKALVQGKKIYDPRLDSTQTDIPGSGSHRLADSTTWEYSTNPSLCVADYLKDTDFGLGVSSSKIDWVAVANAADSCDATVNIPDGSGGSTTEKRFTCNGVIFGTDNHKNNISKILSSMNGTLTYVNGEYIIRAGVYEAPSVSLDDDDLTGAVSIKTSFERSDRFNTIKGIFIDPSQNHKNTEFPKVTITDAVNRDNGEVLEKEIQLPMTNSSYMAQRIANKLIQQSDNQKVITLPVNLSGLNVRVGDRVNVSLSDLSWTNQIFECVGWNFNEEGGVTLTLRQDDSGSYDDLAVSGYSTITATGDITPGFAGVPSPSGLTATAGLKNIELNWTNPAKIDRVREIIVYASANNQWSSSQEIGRTLGTQFIHDGSNGTDAISVGDQRYYWIRSVGNSTGLLSDRNPDSDTSTIQATCGQNASGQQLTTGAVLGLDLFDTDNTTVMGTTDVKNQVTVNIEDENNVILETELGNNFLTQTVGDVGLTVYTEVTDLGAQYSVKIDNNGRVAGFGLSSTLPTNTTDPAFSEFIVIADKFQIVDPAATSNAGIQPFTVTAQKIRMGTDVEISGDLVTLGTISSDRIDVSGVITAGSIITTGSTIANDISIGSGDSIFKADSNGIYLGNATFSSAPFRVTPAGALTAQSVTIQNAKIVAADDEDRIIYDGESNLPPSITFARLQLTSDTDTFYLRQDYPEHLSLTLSYPVGALTSGTISGETNAINATMSAFKFQVYYASTSSPTSFTQFGSDISSSRKITSTVGQLNSNYFVKTTDLGSGNFRADLATRSEVEAAHPTLSGANLGIIDDEYNLVESVTVYDFPAGEYLFKVVVTVTDGSFSPYPATGSPSATLNRFVTANGFQETTKSSYTKAVEPFYQPLTTFRDTDSNEVARLSEGADTLELSAINTSGTPRLVMIGPGGSSTTAWGASIIWGADFASYSNGGFGDYQIGIDKAGDKLSLGTAPGSGGYPDGVNPSFSELQISENRVDVVSPLYIGGGFGSSGVTIGTTGNYQGNGNINIDGTLTQGSDERIKTEINTLDGTKVFDMRGVNFVKASKKGAGVIAQELRSIAPELVHEDDSGLLSVAYTDLVGYLIEAIKHQQKEIQALRDKIDDK